MSIPHQVGSLTELKRKWGIRTPGDLSNLATSRPPDIVEGLVPPCSNNILVGDSGLGKTPLLYQMAVCVAAGIQFLGRAVQQGPVLYVDCENGRGDVHDIVEHLSAFLNLPNPPEELRLWSEADAPQRWGEDGCKLPDLITEVCPRLVILDSLASLYPMIEEKNTAARDAFGILRRAIHVAQCSIISLHHVKKPQEGGFGSLEDHNCRPWFLQARGARALINASDVRLGVDTPGIRLAVGEHEEAALVLAGFGRVRGTIAPTYLARVLDDDGEPLGYRRITGVSLLGNPEQIEAFKQLPAEFRFKDAKFAYKRGGQATTDFLAKCIEAGVLKKAGTTYKKTETADRTD